MSRQRAVYAAIECKYCKSPIANPSRNQEFCQNKNKCKDAFHRENRMNGEKQRKSKGMHFANLSGSPRLQRLLKFLSDGRKHTTWEIQSGARICNVGTTASELRRNSALRKRGFELPPAKYIGETDDGGKIFEYQLINVEA